MKGAVITPINQSEMAVLFIDRNFSMNFINWNALIGNESGNYAWNELPQPQLFTAFGLSNVKPRFSMPS